MSSLQPPLGDDEVRVPDPVTECPPFDRYCDLVLTGGVASGVVYPWAIVELARAFRFKNIGGSSVGAMAAALAAAAEYGRRCGWPYSFEVLRQAPGQLAEDAGAGQTRLLALFQPRPRGQRVFDLFVDSVKVFGAGQRPTSTNLLAWLLRSLWAFKREMALAVFTVLALGALFVGLLAWELTLLAWPASSAWGLLWALPPLALIAAALGLLGGLAGDIHYGLIEPDLGLVHGGPLAGRADDDPGLMTWLHEGIQRSAGLNPLDPKDAPLSFRDLWRAPAYPGEQPPESATDSAQHDARRRRSINLEMVTTNVSHGRPYRLPLDDESSRLYFKPDELAPFFPPAVMQALKRAAEPYRPQSPADPPAEIASGYFELPSADMPIVVAARLSLSFPLLFACVPLYAVDYEMPHGTRQLKRCRFSDGGICSNFPIHLFDAALPRWPTFGMWLGQRTSAYADQAVWLPDNHLQGRGDTWTRFESDDPYAASFDRGEPGPWRRLLGFLVGAGRSAKDWSDRSGMRMPQARNRIARLNLLPGEGELNIAMPRKKILQMAQNYGTLTGLEFVKKFAAAPGAPPLPAWREHQWVRLHTLLASLREFLQGLGRASLEQAHSQPVRELIDLSTQPATHAKGANLLAPATATATATASAPRPAIRPLRLPASSGIDPSGAPISAAQAAALKAMLDAAEELEARLRACDMPLPYRPLPAPELRLRPPI